MHGAPRHRHFSCLMPWCHGPRGHRRASGGGGRGNNHAPGRPRIRSKPWALPLLLRAGTSSPRSPLRPRTCSMTWGKLLSLRAAHLTYKAGMATCTYFTGCWYSGLEPTSGAVELSSHPHPHRAQTVITGLSTSLVLCEPLFPLPPPLVVLLGGPRGHTTWWPVVMGSCQEHTGTLLTAKSLQSCLTLCNPIDGSPPGSPVPGTLQARTLEWVAISFSNAWK